MIHKMLYRSRQQYLEDIDMLKKIFLLLIFIMLVNAACSPNAKSPVVTTQKVNTPLPLSPTLTRMPTLTLTEITPTPTDAYLRSLSGSITVMSGGDEKYNNGIGLLNLENGEIQNIFPDGGVASFTWSPDGKQIAFDGVVDGFSPSHIFMLNVDNKNKKLKQLTQGNNQDEHDLDWSPDGTQIAYVYEYGIDRPPELALFRLSDSVSLQITSTKGAELDPSFSPDGKTLAYIYVEGYYEGPMMPPQLMLMDIKSRKSRQVPLNVPVAIQQVSWSPDGKTIAFVSKTGKDNCGDIYLVSLDDSSVTRLTELTNCAVQVVWSPDGKYLAFVGKDKKTLSNIADSSWQIYVMDSDGQNIVQVTHEKDWIIRDIDWVSPSQ